MYSDIIKDIFIWRKKNFDKELISFQENQAKLLQYIIEKNKSIHYLHSKKIIDSKTFLKSCPSVHYDDIEHFILKIKNQHINDLTTENIIAFSKSSGTTSRSKLIPMTKNSLNANFNAGKTMLSLYLSSNRNSQIICGKNFSLTGSYEIENGYVIGDVSALFTYFLKPWYKPFRTPNKDIATMANWDEKLAQMTPILAKEDIRWIAGVPSWMSIIIDSVEKYTQKPICEVWKNLEVFFYGGVSIEPFISYYSTKFRENIRLWQTYNASEGFFGLQPSADEQNLILLHNTYNYYEFISMEEMELDSPSILSINDLFVNHIYELIITNSSGLYRYRMGDLIEITDLNPLRYKVVGRTKNFINTFGEELMVSNTEKALMKMTQHFHFILNDYTIAPIINGNKGYHKWLIEFEQLPENLNLFQLLLDQELRKINSDYDAKRYNDLILGSLQLKIIPKGSFQKWLEQNKRKNVQSKIPKLWKDETIQLDILKVLGSEGLEI